jgi:hypothetical protein
MKKGNQNGACSMHSPRQGTTLRTGSVRWSNIQRSVISLFLILIFMPIGGFPKSMPLILSSGNMECNCVLRINRGMV